MPGIGIAEQSEFRSSTLSIIKTCVQEVRGPESG